MIGNLTQGKAILMGSVTIVGTWVSEMFGGWDMALTTLVIFMILDYITGILVAGVCHKSEKTQTGKLDSTVCWRGLLKKGMTLVIVLVANRVDLMLGTSFVREAVVIAYIVNETISIIENAGKMGLPVPDALLNAIEQIQGKGDCNSNQQKVEKS